MLIHAIVESYGVAIRKHCERKRTHHPYPASHQPTHPTQTLPRLKSSKHIDGR